LESYCTNSVYRTLMIQQCPFTCGFCGSCFDKVNPRTGASDCPGYKSYCTRPDYAVVMREQCPKTCGFC
uniref:ShTK domain protein n=1 Tax=Angiostrongylus cantonensis TaxID=6313 RepID=A0A0K0CWJ5_ANGCA